MGLFDPAAFARRLCDQWEHTPLLKSQHCPAPDDLGKILESAYLASMATEERRPLKFGLIVRPSAESDEPRHITARFEKPRPLSNAEIRRLAPATGLSSTFIAVEPTNAGPCIWGTVDVGSEWSLRQSAERGSGRGLSSHLIINVTAPGTIDIKFSDTHIYSIEAGQPVQQSCNVLKFGPIREFFRPVMIKLLKEAFPAGDDLISDEFTSISYGGEYLRFLARTLKNAETLGHGGAIIIFRESEITRINDFVSIKYPISNLHLWHDLVRYVTLVAEEIESFKPIYDKPRIEQALLGRWNTARRECEMLNQQLVDCSRFLARLTQVDGALLMTEELRVLGFGAIINDLSKQQESFNFCRDELGQVFEKRRREIYGTRHRSSIELCERMDCLAFVLSQDGGVKALRRQEEQVLLWPAVLLNPAAWAVTAEDMIPQLRRQYLNRDVR